MLNIKPKFEGKSFKKTLQITDCGIISGIRNSLTRQNYKQLYSNQEE